MPIALAGPVGFSDEIACAFCETTAPTREFVREHGWPARSTLDRQRTRVDASGVLRDRAWFAGNSASYS